MEIGSNIPTQVTEAVGATAPISGIEFGSLEDKSTWRCNFLGIATLEQRAAAQAVIDAYSPSDPVPVVISDRQFFQQLAMSGVITIDEALAAVGPGTIPAGLNSLITQLPPNDQFTARMLLTGATQFERYLPLVSSFSSALGWSNTQLDDFWRSASDR